jgi:hypothetical protein
MPRLSSTGYPTNYLPNTWYYRCETPCTESLFFFILDFLKFEYNMSRYRICFVFDILWASRILWFWDIPFFPLFFSFRSLYSIIHRDSFLCLLSAPVAFFILITNTLFLVFSHGFQLSLYTAHLFFMLFCTSSPSAEGEQTFRPWHQVTQIAQVSTFTV